MHKSLFFLSLIVILVACVPESKRTLTEVVLMPTKSEFQNLTKHQHLNHTDSLLMALNSKDPSLRYLAARAFASHPAPKALDSLTSLLNDPVLKIRSMAAYALGQSGSESVERALISGFRQKDTMSVDNQSNGAILEAIGKVASSPLAKYVATADNYRSTDTLLIIGQMKSLYYFALRDITTPEQTNRALDFIKDKSLPPLARLYAAHYFSRSNDLDLSVLKFQLAEAMTLEEDVHVKMALTAGLKHTQDPEIKNILLNQLDLNQDYRVTCNVIKTLTNYTYDSVQPKMLELLRSDNLHVARTAAAYVSLKADPNKIKPYRDIAADSIPWQVRTDLYNAILKVLPYYYTKTKNATRWQLTQALSKETNPKAQGAYLNALGNDPENYKFIMDYIDKSDDPVLKTAGVEALSQLVAHPDFYSVYQNTARVNRRIILNYFKTQMEGGDEGIVGAVANAIADPDSRFKELIDSTGFLQQAKDRLKVPGQIESIHAVEKAIAHLRGVNKPELTKATLSKKLDWSVISKMNQQIKAIVKTSQGNFTINLLTEEAPISVMNFIELSNSNYYDGKIFHRVVPNFVAQTGSPRGDNYGGAAYVISSEFSPISYDDEGYIGMASAGPHTESTQWFVTHSPTPHLDGKYTIFGKVVEGMDVVHKLQKGDEIHDVIVSDL